MLPSHSVSCMPVKKFPSAGKQPQPKKRQRLELEPSLAERREQLEARKRQLQVRKDRLGQGAASGSSPGSPVPAAEGAADVLVGGGGVGLVLPGSAPGSPVPAAEVAEGVLVGGGDSEVGLVVPGSAADLYVPHCNINRERLADVWYFFKKRHSDTTEKAWCQLVRCERPEVAMSKGSTSNLLKHLMGKHHAMGKCEIQAFASRCRAAENEGKALPELPDDSAADPADKKIEASRIRRAHREDLDKARAKAAATRPVQEAMSAAVLLDLEKSARDEANRAFARAFCGECLRPTTIGEGPAPKQFFLRLLQICGATHKWAPPTHQQVSQILREDLQEVEARLSAELKSIPPEDQVLHTDGWSDPWKRVWVGCIVRALTEDWRVLNVCPGFEMVAKFSGEEIGSQHSASAAATAVRAQWRVLGLVLPSDAHSDSCNTAVAVGKLLGMGVMRCLVHILAIASQRVLWEQEMTVQGSKQSKGKTPITEVVDKCRAWALFLYKDEDKHKEFNRARRDLLDDDENILPPKPDSHAKWGSCTAMLARSVASHRIWESLHIQFPRKCPSPLTSDELAQLIGISRGVDAVWAATCLLQKDDKTLGEYAPIVYALRQELASQNTVFSAAYLSELDAAEQRNLSTAPSSDWDSGLDMIHCAALAHPRYRQGKFMSESRRTDMAELFAKHCIRAYKRAHPTKDLDAGVGEGGGEVGLPVPAGFSQKVAQKEKVRGMKALSAWLSDPDEARPMQPPNSKTLRYAIGAQVRSYMSCPAPPGSKDAIAWWRDIGRVEYWAIAPGARSLLKYSTGNATLERLFSRAIRIYGDKARKSADLRRAMLLAYNAYVLGMSGYIGKGDDGEHSGTVEEESEDEGDGQVLVKKAIVA